MPTFGESFALIESALLDRYGGLIPEFDEHADPFASLVAVALGRSVEPRAAVRALDGLRESGLLDPSALAEADPAEIAEVLKASGVSVKANGPALLRRLARWLVEQHEGLAESLRDASVATECLREELSALNGIGPAMADEILLFALRRPVYPVDRATYRILVRHGWLDSSADYDEARSIVEAQRPEAPVALARLSEGMKRLGREFCRVGVPKCEPCPLRSLLPERGPVDPWGS